MNPILDAAAEVQRVFRKKRWRFCFIGALAAIRWGIIRTTYGVDVNLLVKFGKEREIIAGLLESLQPRIDDALEFSHCEIVSFCARRKTGSKWMFPWRPRVTKRRSLSALRRINSHHDAR